MRAIAKKMGRSHTTISRELQRNQDPSLKTYLPDSATSQAKERRHHAQQCFQSFTSQQIEEIRSRLKLYHSPEQIAGRLKKEGLFFISHETIYQMIYLNYQGLGECASYLRQSRRQRRRRSQSQDIFPKFITIDCQYSAAIKVSLPNCSVTQRRAQPNKYKLNLMFLN